MFGEGTLNQAWSALRVVLKDTFTFHDIKDIVGLAGVDVTRLARLEQRAGGGASKGQLITALDGEMGRLDAPDKSRVLNHMVEVIIERRPDQSKCLQGHLAQLGWQLVDARLVPIELFDVSDLAELPDVSRTDLVKAAVRLRDGDLDGALAAACAAVDSATNSVYAECRLGSPLGDGFQARCMNAIKAKGVMSALTSELTDLGWDDTDADKLSKNLQGALNQAAYVMQTLRSRMSDVHGSKRVMKSLVFDSLKWAALIVRMLK